MADDTKVVCPHCNKLRNKRTVRKHLKAVRDQSKIDGIFVDFIELEDSDGDVPATSNPRSPSQEHYRQPTPETQSLGSIAHQSADPATPDLGAQGEDTFSDQELPIEATLHSSPDAGTESVRRNPPVTIEDWPEPDSDQESEDFEHDFDSMPENPDDLYACPHDENDDSEAAQQFAEWTDQRFVEFLQRELGDDYAEELQTIYKEELTQEDKRVIKILSAQLRAHFSKQAYEEIRYSFAEELGLPSEYLAWRRAKKLAGLEMRLYDCCVNSCCAFLGKYRDLDRCPFCQEKRFDTRRRARKVFRYIPLIPQLQAMYQNLSMIDKLRYRYLCELDYQPGTVRDVFDSTHYRLLRERRPDPTQPYCFLDNPRDLALGMSLDGFTMFKRRRKGNSTAWPLILVNYNLPPTIRTHLENVICVGVIPGPKQFKDLNSFLVPLLDELLELETGVLTKDCSMPHDQWFTLRAFLIIAFGDIPAISKLLGVKGHNAISPCRACHIQGVQGSSSNVYYVPLTHPGGDEYWDPKDLPMRTAESFEACITQMEQASTKGARDDLAKAYGINSRCILSTLQTIDLSTSFPYDFMHLMFENIVPNLIRHWTGAFKGLDQGTGHYQLSPELWMTIGRETAVATQTLPSEFVGTLPDIAQDIVLYKAEAYSFWIQYLAPILLKNRLSPKYYAHLLNLRDIIELCLRFELTSQDLDVLEELVVRWVADYEVFYYQYDVARVSACPLTIHALLHVPHAIRQSGPVWTSWAFVMERFCGSLLPAIKNRLNPYPCIDNYVQRRAQLQNISAIYNLRTIQPPRAEKAAEEQEVTQPKGKKLRVSPEFSRESGLSPLLRGSRHSI